MQVRLGESLWSIGMKWTPQFLSFCIKECDKICPLLCMDGLKYISSSAYQLVEAVSLESNSYLISGMFCVLVNRYLLHSVQSSNTDQRFSKGLWLNTENIISQLRILRCTKIDFLKCQHIGQECGWQLGHCKTMLHVKFQSYVLAFF